MSEGIIIALITATGSLLGGIIGQLISASAMLKAAALKENPIQSPVIKERKKLSLSGILKGALLGAVLTLAVLLIMGLFTSQQNKTDKISGTWAGVAKNGDFEFDIEFTIEDSCKINSICGSYDFPSINCSGTLTVINIDGNLFEFQTSNETAGCGEDAYNSFQLLPNKTLLYVSQGDYGESRAVLKKIK
ncbi:MAG: hypothetical protein GY755_01890 [Chloroflexi bacterium]|nr:hypothetical protein [Chloroflexota bacterium]